MTPLRQRVTEDMQLRGSAPATPQAYLRYLCRCRLAPLQQIATAVAMNIDRLFEWFQEVPRAKTRTSRFAALAP